MKKALIISYSSLLILTLSTALIGSSGRVSKIIVLLILGISAIKFLVVAFQFMELKKANSFWKVSLIIVLILLILMIFVII